METEITPYSVYGDARYEHLATLSVSHLYNLRKSAGYLALRVSFTKTHPVCNPIGVRKPPRPNGRAGFVRIDTVHQGDLDGIKGVYHITCVDAVSQWQVQACVQGISEKRRQWARWHPNGRGKTDRQECLRRLPRPPKKLHFGFWIALVARNQYSPSSVGVVELSMIGQARHEAVLVEIVPSVRLQPERHEFNRLIHS